MNSINNCKGCGIGSFIFFYLLMSSSSFLQANLNYFSQNGQDRYLYEQIFKNKKGGVFVEFGASDGIRFSNTYFFEKYFGWTGICIEPNPILFNSLKNNRNCICIEGCISDAPGRARFFLIYGYGIGLSGLIDKYEPAHLERIEHVISSHQSKNEIIDVDCYVLNDILKKHDIYHINYLSIDTEGGELDILKSINFDLYTIDVISVEVNFKNDQVKKFLEKKGYRLLKKIGADEIYKKLSFI